METTCCIKGCYRKVNSMGMCNSHARMFKKYGTPVGPRPLSSLMRGRTAEERFFYCVEKSEGCWIWKASKDKDGYGRFRGEVSGTIYQDAHRFSWAFHTGEVLTRKIQVLHTCDNPSCVNPNHLISGTAHENSLDMVSKGRQSRGEKHARLHSKLTEDQAREIAADPRRYEDIAKDYGCTCQCVFSIKNRKTWRFLSNLIVIKNKKGSKGESRSQSLTDDDIRAIRASTEKGSTLASHYNISQQTICDIRKRRSWKHVN